MLSSPLQLTIIPCGKQEPFRGEPASCSALNTGMLILPYKRPRSQHYPRSWTTLAATSTLLQTILASSQRKISFPAEESPQHSQSTTQHHQIQTLIHLNQWMLDLSPKPFTFKATWTFSLKAQIILINIFPSSLHKRKRCQYKSTALCIWLY